MGLETKEAEEETTEKAGESEKREVKIELDAETVRLLNIRKRQKSKKPVFKQTDSHKKKKLADYWRRPDGIHNKTRYHVKGKCPMVQAGYGGPSEVRGLHPSGFEEVLVYTPKALSKVETSQAVRIARTVGRKKRLEIEAKAKEIGLKILNPLGEKK